MSRYERRSARAVFEGTCGCRYHGKVDVSAEWMRLLREVERVATSLYDRASHFLVDLSLDNSSHSKYHEHASAARAHLPVIGANDQGRGEDVSRATHMV